MGEYRKAEICLNGHPTTSDFEHSVERASPYCSKCGAQTIRKCPACKLFIRGRYHIEGGFFGGGKYQAPAYCHLWALLHDSTAARVGALFQLLVQDTTAQDFGLPSSAIRLRM